MKVVCFGDSNTYGYDPRGWPQGRYEKEDRWVDILEEKTGWDVQNFGLNGREIPKRVAAMPAGTDMFIIMLGTNDITLGIGPEAAAKRMEVFITGLDIAREKILLIAPPPVRMGQWVQEQRLIDDSVRLAPLYEELASRLGTGFADAGKWDVAMSYDGVHFTEEGHRNFAEGLYEFLEKNRLKA